MFTENDTDAQPHLPKKRQPNAANRTAREAIKLVQPTNARIAEWQLALARHTANAERMTRRGEKADGLRAELEALRQEVATERKRLEVAIAEAPELVVANTRVHDSQRALTLVDTRVGNLLRSLM